jgi:hypothetical protein
VKAGQFLVLKTAGPVHATGDTPWLDCDPAASDVETQGEHRLIFRAPVAKHDTGQGRKPRPGVLKWVSDQTGGAHWTVGRDTQARRLVQRVGRIAGGVPYAIVKAGPSLIGDFKDLSNG